MEAPLAGASGRRDRPGPGLSGRGRARSSPAGGGLRDSACIASARRYPGLTTTSSKEMFQAVVYKHNATRRPPTRPDRRSQTHCGLARVRLTRNLRSRFGGTIYVEVDSSLKVQSLLGAEPRQISYSLFADGICRRLCFVVSRPLPGSRKLLLPRTAHSQYASCSPAIQQQKLLSTP